MRRREFITLLSGATAWPLAARAQRGRPTRRVAILIDIPENDPQAALRVSAIQNGLQERGWSDIRFDIRYSARDTDHVRSEVTELLALRPDVIFAGNTSALAAINRQTQAVPVVFAQVDDPVVQGFVKSLARPGGNITGFTSFEKGIGGKWLQLLKDVTPSIAHVGFIYDPANPAGARHLEGLMSAGGLLNIHVRGAAVHDGAEIATAIDQVAETRNGGLVVLGGPATAAYRDRIITSAARHLLPAVYPYRYFVASGGLLSYGPDTVDVYRHAASYIDRILRGEQPADLPVQQPTKYELVINLKTAKALGLDVPPTLLARADEVVE
jgi:putative ABC transport system substrate-binding protein